MSRHIGQQVVVENRTGAGGTIGMDTAMKSPPDGYTVLITNDNAASAPHIMNLPYDYTKELLPVIYLGRQPQVLGVASVARRELGDGADRLREGESGARLRHLRRRLQPAHHRRVVQARRPGSSSTTCPYRGAGQAINDLVAGHVKIALLGPTALVPQLQGRQAQAAGAVLGEARAVPCGAFRRSRRPASRAWCSKPGTRPSCRRARRRRSSRSSTPR